jgi:hypothetical protein
LGVQEGNSMELILAAIVFAVVFFLVSRDVFNPKKKK